MLTLINCNNFFPSKRNGGVFYRWNVEVVLHNFIGRDALMVILNSHTSVANLKLY